MAAASPVNGQKTAEEFRRSMAEIGLKVDEEMLAALDKITKIPSCSDNVLKGAELLENPVQAMADYAEAGGCPESIVSAYLDRDTPLHLLGEESQPQLLRATMKMLAPALIQQLITDAGVKGASATMLAEQVVEARCDEAYARALAGEALGAGNTTEAGKLHRLADQHSRRMIRAMESLNRLRKPKVSVKVNRVGNLNLGEQIVNGSDDGRHQSRDDDDALPSKRGSPLGT